MWDDISGAPFRDGVSGRDDLQRHRCGLPSRIRPLWDTTMSVSVANVQGMNIASSVAILISLGSLYVSYRAYQHAKYAPVREGQTPLRNELRNELHKFDYYRIGKLLNQLQERIPSADAEGELRKLGESIALRKGSFVAPTPQQLQTLIDTIESTRAAYDETRQPPKTDAAFGDGYQATQRKMLTERFTALRRQIRCVVGGLDAIQTKPMSPPKQIKQFKELDR